MALVPVDRAPALPRQYRQRLQRGAPASDDGDGADSSQAPVMNLPFLPADACSLPSVRELLLWSINASQYYVRSPPGKLHSVA